MGIFDTLNLHFDKKKWIFPNLIFQLHPIITSLILDQLACSLPKSNTTFHQIFKYVKKGANFPFFEWENSKYIFGRRSSIETVSTYAANWSKWRVIIKGAINKISNKNHLKMMKIISFLHLHFLKGGCMRFEVEHIYHVTY